jgi:predicted site-specific integrase-resolvase
MALVNNPIPTSTEFLPLREAAEVLGVSYHSAYRYAREGLIPGVFRVGNTTVVPRASVVAMRDDKSNRGAAQASKSKRA